MISSTIDAPSVPQSKKKILFVRPTMGQGGADRVTLHLLRNIDREKYSPELALMKHDGVFLNDIPDDIPIHNCNARSLWWMVGPLSKLVRKNNYDIVYSTCSGMNIPTLLAKAIYR